MKQVYKVMAMAVTAAAGAVALVYRISFRMPLKEYTASALYMAVLDDEISRRELAEVAVFSSKKESLQYKYHLFLEVNRKRSRKKLEREIYQMESHLERLNEEGKENAYVGI